MTGSRRTFLKNSTLAAGGALIAGSAPSVLFPAKSRFDFTISLAQYSLHRALFGGELDNLDFPEKAKRDFGVDAVEYVNIFFPDKAEDAAYLSELKRRTDDLGLQNVLIMIDREGDLAARDAGSRQQAVENHYKWIDAAKFLGCHSIRVNLFGAGMAGEWVPASVDGLGRLAEYGEKNRISILVENHGSFSSDGGLLAEVMRQVDSEWAGTLPDFGNFCIRREGGACAEQYDLYKGTEEMMPFAKGVSAKSYDFDEQGFETTIDFRRMFRIIRDSGFSGHIGIEYEGDILPEDTGILYTKRLLERMREEFT